MYNASRGKDSQAESVHAEAVFFDGGIIDRSDYFVENINTQFLS